MYSPTDLLIVAAHAPELEPFRALLGEGLTGTVRGLRVAARPVGIGLALAAAGVSYRIATRRPRAVVMVGSCGAYPDGGRSLGDVIVASAVHLADPAIVTGAAYFPAPMVTVVETDPALREGLEAEGAIAAAVANPLAITSEPARAETLARATGCAIEHLEAFALAAVCAKERTRFAVLLGVANMVGPGAHAEWKAHARAAHEAVGAVVNRWLSAQAPGLLAP